MKIATDLCFTKTQARHDGNCAVMSIDSDREHVDAYPDH